MKRHLACVLALVVGMPLIARAAINNPGNSPIAHVYFEPETHVVGTSLVQCDVMRDYYYNVDTGEFLGWAGEPYVTNCQTIGSTTDSPPCAPFDFTCQCGEGEESSSNPNCAPNPGPCGELTGFAALVAGCPQPQPPKPPKKCAQCLSEQNKKLSASAQMQSQCVSTWASVISDNQCRNGMIRRHGQTGAVYDAPTKKSIALWGVSHCTPTPTGDVCAMNPYYQMCYEGWMNGYYFEQTVQKGDVATGSGTINATIPVPNGTGGITPIPVGSVTGTYTTTQPDQTTTLQEGQGLVSECQKDADERNLKIKAEFKKCAASAPDHQGTLGNYYCPTHAP